MIKKTMVLVAVAVVSVAVNVLHSDTSYAQSSVPSPTFHAAIALDELGSVVPGAAYEGWGCTSFAEENQQWSCFSLNDNDWFDPALANTGVSSTEIFNNGSRQSVTACSDPLVDIFIAIRQTAAIPGYTFSDGWNVFCLVAGGWVSDGTQIVDKPIFASAQGTPVPAPFTQVPPASLANGVTITTTGTFLDADGFPTISQPITFGGLLGATAAAKIPAPVPSPPTPALAPATTQRLADTGADTYMSIFYLTIVTLGSAGLLLHLRVKASHN